MQDDRNALRRVFLLCHHHVACQAKESCAAGEAIPQRARQAYCRRRGIFVKRLREKMRKAAVRDVDMTRCLRCGHYVWLA